MSKKKLLDNPDKPDKPDKLVKSERKSKRIEEYTRSVPEQLSLFQLPRAPEKSYSNTIELYDFIPKYKYGKVKRIQDRFLDALKRDFVYKDAAYKIEIDPARITDGDEVDRHYYPSLREELVEDALRRLATAGKGVFLDDNAGVEFTLYELQKELKENGHTYSYAQIKDALLICARTNISISTSDGNNIFASNLFETVGLSTREDWKNQGTKTKAFVRFNSLVSKSIKQGMYRLYNYKTVMKYRSVISRQLHKRMSHHFKQASVHIPYNIRLSTIIRDFGLTEYERPSQNLRDVVIALEEMVAARVVLKFDTKNHIDTKNRNKIIDATFEIYPDPHFVSEIIDANRREQLTNPKDLKAISRRKDDD